MSGYRHLTDAGTLRLERLRELLHRGQCSTERGTFVARPGTHSLARLLDLAAAHAVKAGERAAFDRVLQVVEARHSQLRYRSAHGSGLHTRRL